MIASLLILKSGMNINQRSYFLSRRDSGQEDVMELMIRLMSGNPFVLLSTSLFYVLSFRKSNFIRLFLLFILHRCIFKVESRSNFISMQCLTWKRENGKHLTCIIGLYSYFTKLSIKYRYIVQVLYMLATGVWCSKRTFSVNNCSTLWLHFLSIEAILHVFSKT